MAESRSARFSLDRSDEPTISAPFLVCAKAKTYAIDLGASHSSGTDCNLPSLLFVPTARRPV